MANVESNGPLIFAGEKARQIAVCSQGLDVGKNVVPPGVLTHVEGLLFPVLWCPCPPAEEETSESQAETETLPILPTTDQALLFLGRKQSSLVPIEAPIEDFACMDQSRWKELAPMGDQCCGLAAVLWRDAVFVLGRGRASAQVLSHDKWVAAAPMQIARTRFSVSVVGHHVFVIGGIERTCQGRIPLAEVERYDVTTNAWTRTVSMLRPRAGHRSCTIGNSIYVFGGWISPNDRATTVDCFDGDTWTTFATMSPRTTFGLAVLGFTVYVAGGVLSTFQSFDITSKTWRDLAPMSTARLLPALVTHEHYVYAIGGVEAGKYLTCVERYDTRMNRWDKLPSLPVFLWGETLALVS